MQGAGLRLQGLLPVVSVLLVALVAQVPRLLLSVLVLPGSDGLATVVVVRGGALCWASLLWHSATSW